MKKLIVEKSTYMKQVKAIRKDIYNSSKYYPILIKSNKKKGEDAFNFENSWSMPRSYGGARKHEGTDIMYKDNKSDEVPIVSISDGIIVKKDGLSSVDIDCT